MLSLGRPSILLAGREEAKPLGFPDGQGKWRQGRLKIRVRDQSPKGEDWRRQAEFTRAQSAIRGDVPNKKEAQQTPRLFSQGNLDKSDYSGDGSIISPVPS